MTTAQHDAPEFSRQVDIRQADGPDITVTANDVERLALARRFEIVAIERLEATVTPSRVGDTVGIEGRLRAAVVQSCAVSGEDLAVVIDEPVTVRFVPAREPGKPNEEIELEAEDCDEIEYTGTTFDLGEAVAQSLALAIDPFVTGPGAEAARRAAGLLDEAASGPFAILAQLKKN